MRQFALACLCTGALLSPLGVQAQDSTDDPVAEAKRLFDDAIVQLTAGRADIGRDLLRRSLALDTRKSTRFNLGVALRRTGETTEAVATFDGLLRERSLTKKERAEVKQELAAAKTELATIVVTISGTKTANLELDGRDLGEVDATQPLRFRVDPGEHVLVARSGGTTRQQVNVNRGATAELNLHVLSLEEQNDELRKQRRRKRAAWIVPASAAVAAIIIGTVIATRPSGETPLVDGDTPAVGTGIRMK